MPKPSSEELERQELEAKLDVSAQRAFGVIEEARRQMKPKERERADRKADAIIRGVMR